MKQWLIIGLVVAGIGYWLWRGATAPTPGEVVTDLGRNHVTDISGMEYNSNPPTSGKHFPVWAKRGVYDQVISDGYLIHSLEHGYIVISYNCSQSEKLKVQNENLFTVYAHEGDEIPAGEPHPATGSAKTLMLMTVNLPKGMSAFTPENPPAKEVELPESFANDQCQQLTNTFKGFYESHKSKRLIVVPRPNLDGQLTLTAWGRILKMGEWDEKQAEVFVNAWENRGPEQTVE